MKTRNGFVSNSSTSSFIVIGYKYTPEVAKQLAALNRIPTADEDGKELDEDTQLEFMRDGVDMPYGISLIYKDDDDDIIGATLGSEEDMERIMRLAAEVQDFVGSQEKPKMYSWTSYN